MNAASSWERQPADQASASPLIETPIVDLGLRCEQCDYNLTGLTVDRCPECGTTFTQAREEPGSLFPFSTMLFMWVVVCCGGLQVTCLAALARTGYAQATCDGSINGSPASDSYLFAVAPLALIGLIASALGAGVNSRLQVFSRRTFCVLGLLFLVELMASLLLRNY